MAFTLPPLPFAYNALEPYIDEETMKLHHDKHHQTYVDKLNAAIVGHPELGKKSVEELLTELNELPEEIKTAVRNHGGGHSNHSLFWTFLSPEKKAPSEKLKSGISGSFGSWDKFVEVFNTAATNHFGSGWAWLIKNGEGKYEVKSYLNQESPYTEGANPILCIDVWEHAYYLKYQNRRADYIKAFWNIINWDEVEKRWTA